eukprot:10504983-Alexandrium_andersonii.AAC.1
MRQGAHVVRALHVVQPPAARLLRRLPAHGLRQPEGTLAALLVHGQEQEVLPDLQGAQVGHLRQGRAQGAVPRGLRQLPAGLR